MDTERKYFNQNELTAEELENVVDVSEFILNCIEQEKIFNETFDPSFPSRAIEYKRQINKLPSEYNEKNIEGFEKPYIGNIIWNSEMGVLVETIQFFSRDDDIEKIKYLNIPLADACESLELCNSELIHTQKYENFQRAIEYFAEDIISQESLRRFLENPGYFFRLWDKKGEVFPLVKTKKRSVSLHEKKVYLSKEEMSNIQGWKYLEIFELFKFAFIVDKKFRAEYISKLVENYLRNLDDDNEKGLFSYVKSNKSGLIIIVSKEDQTLNTNP